MALDFNANANGTADPAQYIDFGSIDVPSNTLQMSLFCWAFINTIGDTRMAAKADGAASVQDAWWLTGIDSGGHKSRLRTNNNTDTLSLGSVYPTGEWLHTGFTYHSAGDSGAGWIGYLNGSALGSSSGKSGSVNIDNTVDFWIGGNPPITEPRQFDGHLADVRVYTRALTAAEMQTIYASRGTDGIVDGLLHRWPLDELELGAAATGTGTIKDVGPGKIDGDPVGSPTYVDSPLRTRRLHY